MIQFNDGERKLFYESTAAISQLAALFLLGMDKAKISHAISKIEDINTFVSLLENNHPKKCKRDNSNYFGFDCAINSVLEWRDFKQSEINSGEVTFTVEDLVTLVSTHCGEWDKDRWMSLKMAIIARIPGIENREVHEYAETLSQESSDEFAIQLATHEADTLRSIEEA